MTQIVSLTGVYHADGTVLGELRYWFGARLGRAHCALCDITHGSVREKDSWRQERATLPVPFTTVHLNDRPAAVRAVSEGRTPCVVAHLDDGTVELLLGPDALEACHADPARLVAVVGDAMAARAASAG